MSKGQKITLGCLGSLVVMILIGYFTLQWAKRKVVSVIAESAKTEVMREIKKSPLPEDQKQAFTTAVDEILSNMSSGEIDFTFKGQFADKPKATRIIADALKKAVNKLDIEAEQKTKIGGQIDRFGNAFSKDLITEKDVADMSEKMMNGEFGKMMAIWAAELKYIHASGLSQDEKDKAHITFGRLTRGLKDGKIPRRAFNSLTAPYSEKDEDGVSQIKETLTDEEVRSFLTQAEKLLADNEVSQEPLKLDIGQELKEALDDAGVPQ